MHNPSTSSTSSVLVAPASIIGSELPVQLGSGPSLCPTPISHATTTSEGPYQPRPAIQELGQPNSSITTSRRRRMTEQKTTTTIEVLAPVRRCAVSGWQPSESLPCSESAGHFT